MNQLHSKRMHARFRRATLRTSALAALLALAGCSSSSDNADPMAKVLLSPPEGPLLASVNGEAISEPLLATYARGRGLDPADPVQRQTAQDGLIESMLLAHEALTSGVANGDEARADVALLRVQYLASRALSDYQAKLDVSDGKVLEYYQQEATRAGSTEWRLEHILLEDEATARAVAERATAEGADFGALMSEYSAVARQAKSLDWAIPTRLPKELAEVAAQLPDGKVAPAPIQTSFGWHVLRRAESRPFAPPDFETVKEAARKQLSERAVKDYIASLRAKAKIAEGASAPAGK
ncbi:MAG: peptidylprolyl isomerase [Pseudomarimonas sp.]